MKGIVNYIKSLANAGSLDSSKSFSLLVATFTGALIGICVCFCLVWDVCTNGYIKTNLNDLGLFMVCVGGYVVGGSFSKAFPNIFANKRKVNDDKK